MSNEGIYVIRGWDNDAVLGRTHDLKTARKRCREQGHRTDNNGIWYLPVAYVEDPNGYVVYNPRFKVPQD